MRTILTILVLLILRSANSLGQSKTIAVYLEPVVGYLPDSYQTISTGFSNYMPGYEEREFADFKGIPTSLVEKKIRYHDFIRGQENYQLYRKGKLRLENWQAFIKRSKIDTTQLCPYPVKSRINILIGKNEQQRRVIIVDANNNQDFGDDQALSYPMTLEGHELDGRSMYGYLIKPIIDTLPTVRVDVEAYNGRQVVKNQVLIQPNPYPFTVRPYESTDARFYLSLGIYEHRSGSALVLGHPIKFLLGSGGFELKYNTEATEIRKRDTQTKSKNEETFEPIVYRLGQTFLLANHMISINRVSPLGDTLYLEDKGVVNKAPGFQTGFYAPSIAGSSIDNEPYEVMKQRNEYVVLDFWGSWCGPCIAMIPHLRDFASKYADKPVRLISVARERTADPTALRQLISKHQLTWLQLWESPTSTNSLVKTFAIEAFPTTILIAPDGKILYRATGEAGFTALESQLEKELARSDRK
jgi:thiol-disulfide isomerase/thioredoxin